RPRSTSPHPRCHHTAPRQRLLSEPTCGKGHTIPPKNQPAPVCRRPIHLSQTSYRSLLSQIHSLLVAPRYNLSKLIAPHLRGNSSTIAPARDDAACATPSLRSGECVRESR